MHLRVLSDGAVAAAAAVSEEFLEEASELHRRHCIGLVWRWVGETRSYAFTCPPKPRVRHTLSVLEAFLSVAAHYIGGVGGGEKGSWRKF